MPAVHPPHDHPAVHGMLIVGESRILLSHLPMFHPPHDYQILLEVSVREDDGDPFGAYVRDRRESGERLYTWVPKPFALSRLRDAAQEPFAMEGTIFRGHFERGGVPISSDGVLAVVTRLLYFRKFAPAAPRPQTLQYLLFGSPEEPFLAHAIARPPDYDHILSARIAGPPGWDGAALPVEITGRANTPEDRLREGEEIEARPLTPEPGDPASVVIGRDYYFETGDLAT